MQNLRNHLTNASSSKKIDASVFPTRTQESPSLQAVLHTECVILVLSSQLLPLGGLHLQKIPSGILSGKSIEIKGGECESRSLRRSRAGPERRRVCSLQTLFLAFIPVLWTWCPDADVCSHVWGPGVLLFRGDQQGTEAKLHACRPGCPLQITTR